MLLEVQALLSPNSGSSPRRAVVGWDSARLNMLLAVLETRCGLKLSGMDVYLNVAGGYRLTDPAADCAVAAALVSALADKPLGPQAVWFGEVSLAGEVRAVAHVGLRLREAAKLGFANGFGPAEAKLAKGEPLAGQGVNYHPLVMLPNLVDRVMGGE